MLSPEGLDKSKETELAKRLYPPLLDRARRRLPAHEVENAVQETLAQFFQAVRKGEAVEKPEHLAQKILTRIIQRIWSRCNLTTPLNPVDEPVDPEKNADEKIIEEEERQAIWDSLKKLPSSCQELVRLYVVEGMTFKQLEKRLKRSDNALCYQLRGCLKKLSRELRKKWDK